MLTDVLAAFRSGRAVASETVGHEPWALRFTNPVGMVFHIVLHGPAWLTTEAADPLELSPGDVVLMPHPGPHELSDRPGREPVDFTSQITRDHGPVARLELPGDGAESRLLCGAYLVQGVRSHPLLRAMPALIHVPAHADRNDDLGTALGLLRSEIERKRPGSATTVASLVDTLLVYILRSQFSESSNTWSQALTDPEIAAALHAIHERPAAPWTVEGLAHHVGMSRAAFAKRFQQLVGEPPLTYLTTWRMTTAARALREEAASLTSVARRVGYTSEYAFSRAFKRFHGVPPGAYRNRSRNSRDDVTVARASVRE